MSDYVIPRETVLALLAVNPEKAKPAALREALFELASVATPETALRARIAALEAEIEQRKANHAALLSTYSEISSAYNDCHSDRHALRARVAALEAENERLRETVERAFREGWTAGYMAARRDDPSAEAQDWADSEARAALGREK